MELNIGQIAFEAYVNSVNGKTHDGKDIPAWEDLTQSVKDAWEEAAVAVSAYIFEQRAHLKSDKLS